jgi:hypothetical protein
MCQECRTKACAAITNAQCAYCAKPFRTVRRSSGELTRTCSKSCGQQLRIRESGLSEEIIRRKRAKAHRKNWRRRADRRLVAGDGIPVTGADERAMRAAAVHCPLCQILMTDAPFLPHSRELDHILPVNMGGTRTVGNVRIICRACNMARPHDGSDFDSPVALLGLS